MIHRAIRPTSSSRRATPLPPRPYDIEACYRYCEQMCGATHHNYPVASLFVPSHLRQHIWAVYAFARGADDIADEPRYAGRRAAELDAWQQQLRSIYFEETPDHPVFIALAHTIDTFDLPITEFEALLRGFRLDLDAGQFATFADLRAYTMLSAAPVARMYLALAGYRDSQLVSFGDDLACALSVTKVIQDIRADVDRGRVYVPAEDLYDFGVSVDQLRAGARTPRIDALIRFQVARARALFERARPLVDSVDADLAVELALMWHGGAQMLTRIDRAGSGILTDRPRLTTVDKARALKRALAWRGGTLPERIAGAADRHRWLLSPAG